MAGAATFETEDGLVRRSPGQMAAECRQAQKAQSGERECGRFRNGIGKASGARAAAGGLAEVGAPVGVVILRVGRAKAFSPFDVIGCIDGAVLVVVACNASGGQDGNHARRVELRNVPSETRGQRRQAERRKCAGM